MLVIDALIFETWSRAITTNPDVMLPRHFAKLLVIWHCRILLCLCCHSEPAVAEKESLATLRFFASLNMNKSQIASRRLLALDGFEERFEIAFAETLSAFALNDLEKERWAIFHRLCEDLQQITFIIAIDENTQLFQCVQFFVDVANTIEQRVIVSRRNSQELEPALLQRSHGFNDVVRTHRDVLHAFAVVKLKIFFNLRFLFPFRRFVNRKLHEPIAIAHHLAHQRRVFGGNIFVVERENVSKSHYVFVKLYPRVHLVPSDVADA